MMELVVQVLKQSVKLYIITQPSIKILWLLNNQASLQNWDLENLLATNSLTLSDFERFSSKNCLNLVKACATTMRNPMSVIQYSVHVY